MSKRTLFLVAVSILAATGMAQGGPPLITDDTGTVPTHKWEFNLAWLSEHSNGSWTHEAPVFDFNYGVSDRQHINFEVPYVTLSEGGSTRSGIGNLGLGTKIRFREAKGRAPSVSIHPAVELGLSSRSARLGLVERATSFIFPLDIQWELPNYGLNGEVGFAGTTGQGLQWFSGLAVGKKFGQWEALAELHFQAAINSEESMLLGQVGFRRELTEASSVLFALGRSLATHNMDSITLTSYIALQLRF